MIRVKGLDGGPEALSHISNPRIAFHLRMLARLPNLSKRLRIERAMGPIVLSRGHEQDIAQWSGTNEFVGERL